MVPAVRAARMRSPSPRRGASVIPLDICQDIEGNNYPLARREDLDETVNLVEKEGVKAYAIECDVRERSQTWDAVAEGVRELGRLDIVVANAGICPMGKRAPLQSWSDTIDVDLAGVFNLVQGSLQHLESGASIIATGSLAAQLGRPAIRVRAVRRTAWPSRSSPGTSTTSHRSWAARESASTRCTPPTATPTCCTTRACTVSSADLEHPTLDDVKPVFPMMHSPGAPYIEPRDVSNAVVFLASEDSRYITGMQLRIDAGGYAKTIPWKG